MSDTVTPAPASDSSSPEAPVVEPVSQCGACGQSDDHPKNQIYVGYSNVHTGGQMFHEHDLNRDGVIEYHFDCPTEWHAVAVANKPEHAKTMELAKSGVHGDELRARIVGGTV